MNRTHTKHLTFLLAASIGAACNFVFPLDGLHEAVVADASVQPIPDGDTDASLCPKGQTLCGSTCRDLSSDPENCGACGEVCKQTNCRQSFCEPAMFVGERGAPDKIVVDGQTVYWMVRTPSNSRVFSVNLADFDAGVDKRSVFPAAQYDLALSGGRLLTRDSQAIYARDVGSRPDGGAEVVRVNAPEHLLAFAPFLDDTTPRLAYVVSSGDDLIGRTTTSIGEDAGQLRTQFTANFPEPQSVRDFTIDQLEAYFITESPSGASIVRATKIGPGAGNVSIVSQNVQRPGGIAFSPDGNLAWTGEHVVTAGRGGAALRVVARSEKGEVLSALAYPGGEIYYLVPSEREIRRVTLDGGAPVAIGAADTDPSDVAVTPEYVMWIRGGSLAVLRR